MENQVFALPDNHGRLWLALGILIVWFSAVAGAFFFFRIEFASTWYSFEGEAFSHQKLEVANQKTVVHFVDEACPCTKFSLPHISDLETEYEGQARFISLSAAGASIESGQLPDWIGNMPPASPSVAVWSAEGELQYFGPYTSGEICGVGEDLLEPVLAGASSGQRLNQEGVGCFCPWIWEQTSNQISNQATNQT